MKLGKLAPFALAAAFLVGCAGFGEKSDKAPGIEGAWVSTTEPSGTDFELAHVTFNKDGSYTAKVKYANQERDDTGTWTFEDGKLVLKGHSTRTYDAALKDGKLVITNPENKTSVTLKHD